MMKTYNNDIKMTYNPAAAILQRHYYITGVDKSTAQTSRLCVRALSFLFTVAQRICVFNNQTAKSKNSMW